MLRERSLIRREAKIAEYENGDFDEGDGSKGYVWAHRMDWHLLIGRNQGMLGRQLKEAIQELRNLQGRRLHDHDQADR
jgi:hypothetical protein